MFIGEAIFWYLPEWLVVLGVKTFAANPFTAFYIFVIVFTLLIAPIKYFSRQRKKE